MYPSTLHGKSENLPSKTPTSICSSPRPFSPYIETLKYLFSYWMALDYYYNISSFLCRGSLIGSLRYGDLIPCHGNIDVCVTLKNNQKVRLIR